MVSFVASAATPTGNVATLNITWPVVAPDDVAIIGWVMSNTTTPSAAPSGFTQIGTRDSTTGSARTYIYRKVCLGSEDGVALALTCLAGNRHSGFMKVYRGLDPAEPIVDIQSLPVATAGTARPCPQVVPTYNDCVIAAMSLERNSSGTTAWTAPTGYTKRQDVFNGGTGGTAASGADDGLAAGRLAGVGVTPPDYVSNFSSASGVSWSLALKPLGASGGGGGGYSDNSDMFAYLL